MLTSVVLTVIGPDRPGLVNALADKAATLGGNWLDARMAHLAGQFAGIVHLQVPQASADALIAGLRELESIGLGVDIVRSDAPSRPAGTLLALELIGQDKPGIVRDVSATLAAHGVSIEELESEVVSAAMSGEQMFQARARLRVPESVSTHELQRVLEALANELMVDLQLAPPSTGG
jgi:glycine cleavage system regulatory protein